MFFFQILPVRTENILMQFTYTLQCTLLTELNAQQEPQFPWSFTAVTAPLFLQSTSSGSFALAGLMKVAPIIILLFILVLFPLNPFMVFTNSWCNCKKNIWQPRYMFWRKCENIFHEDKTWSFMFWFLHWSHTAAE